METITRTKIVDVLKSEAYGTTVNVKGWVRTRRGSKQVSFIALNDGSTINNVQIVVDVEKLGEEYLKPHHYRCLYQCERRTGKISGTGTECRDPGNRNSDLRYGRSCYLSVAEERTLIGIPA